MAIVRGTQRKVLAMYAVLAAINAIVWILALILFAPTHSLLLGTAVLAYTFGLRHAVDADHICAIDNVTRKLMQEGKRPVGVGFYFSLGHSTIVIALTVLIAFAATAIRANLPSFAGIGGVVGTLVSAAFLLLIAAINALVLVDILRAFREAKRGGTICERAVDESLERRGLLGRLLKPFLRLVSKSRHMYLVGLLFGLGFDTASEVGLLGIAAIEASKGLPIWSILIFPALFTAGMSLIDTTDGILMLGAYGWAFIEPARKLSYNLTITSASVFVAILVGGLEIAGLLGGNVDATWLGFAIIGAFVACWLLSCAIYRIARPAAERSGSISSATSQASM